MQNCFRKSKNLRKACLSKIISSSSNMKKCFLRSDGLAGSFGVNVSYRRGLTVPNLSPRKHARTAAASHRRRAGKRVWAPEVQFTSRRWNSAEGTGVSLQERNLEEDQKLQRHTTSLSLTCWWCVFWLFIVCVCVCVCARARACGLHSRACLQIKEFYSERIKKLKPEQEEFNQCFHGNGTWGTVAPVGSISELIGD